MYAQPAKKLLFMGGEFGQWAEWSHEESLEWHLLQHDSHKQLQRWVADLNRTYRAEKALHELDCDPAGFEWIDGSDSQQSMLSFMRRSAGGSEIVVAVFNFTPVPRPNYRVGVPRGGYWKPPRRGRRRAERHHFGFARPNGAVPSSNNSITVPDSDSSRRPTVIN